MNERKAFTLVELTVTMSTGSAMMILAIGMLHQSMSLATTARQRAEHQQALDRLAREFRRDTHRAARCTVGPEDAIELVMTDDSVVSYRAQDNHITRQQPMANGHSRREVFTLNDQSSATFESLANPSRAVLTVMHLSPGGSIKSRFDCRVAAVIGRLTIHERGERLP